MFSFSSLVIFSAIAFGALTLALSPQAPPTVIAVDLVVRSTGVATTVPAGSTLGSRDAPQSIAMVLSSTTDCIKQAAAHSESSTEAFSKMHDCMNVATVNVNGLRGQSKEVMLAPADGSDATLSNADLGAAITQFVDTTVELSQDLITVLPAPSGDTVMSLSGDIAGLLAASESLLSVVDIVTGPLLSASTGSKLGRVPTHSPT